MPENFQMRDVFNPKAVNKMAARIKARWPAFKDKKFCKEINPKLPALTYSERLKYISNILEKYLPGDFPTAADILINSQLPKYGNDLLGDSNDRFITVTQSAYIARKGLDHFDISMNALYEMTQRFSAEWDIRAFIIKYPEKTLAVLAEWAKDPSPHVRRLVSEGSRPLLPWGKRLHQFVTDPKPTLLLLDLLKNDPSEYVRRSVANHLNDHAKKHPDLVVKTLKKWKKEHPSKNMERMIKHATRTLIKDGHPGALQLLGFKKGASVIIKNIKATPKLSIGEYLYFSFDIISTGKTKQKLAIDYIIYFKKSNGELAPKVFKLTVKELKKSESLSLQKKHSFKIITTRKYYAGTHELGVQVNGEEKGKTKFNVTV
ncbi:MAG TPA: DNA alkylation repair protein [Bacteroidetes bacterium]|nr:DNA alkylation repair protein [Bacteroidota bacterium]